MKVNEPHFCFVCLLVSHRLFFRLFDYISFFLFRSLFFVKILILEFSYASGMFTLNFRYVWGLILRCAIEFKNTCMLGITFRSKENLFRFFLLFFMISNFQLFCCKIQFEDLNFFQLFVFTFYLYVGF